jgi:hypothetical protein
MKENQQIPTPAPPVNRRERLPWQLPKAIEEDAEAARRVQAILKSPSYRPADTDTEFLAEEDLRGVRLQIDYLKPEFVAPRARDRASDCGLRQYANLRACGGASQSAGATRAAGNRQEQQRASALAGGCRTNSGQKWLL